jgi:hypothetical protein
VGVVQDEPWGRLQRPDVHPYPGAQSWFPVHAARQSPALQTYPLHDVTPPSTHVPAPLQVSTRFRVVLLAHEGGAHTVEAE